MMKSISISIAALLIVLLSCCQNKKVETSSVDVDDIDSVDVDTLKFVDEEFPAITLENADSILVQIQKEFEHRCSPTTLTFTEGQICYVRNAIDSLTMVRYHKASEGQKNKSAVQSEYKCWQELEEALENFHLVVILKHNEDDPWKFLYARQADKQLFQAHTKMLNSDMEQMETCEERTDFKSEKSGVTESVKKLKDAFAKYKSDAPTEYKILIPLIDKWVKVRAAETLPLPYYNKDKNTESFIKDIICYIKTIEDYVE